MATKIVIQELISKYTFEVDKTGSKTYQKTIKDGEDAAGKATTKAVTGAKKEAAARLAASKKIAAEIKRQSDINAVAIRRRVEAGDKAAARAVATAKREATKVTTLRAKANAAARAGDMAASRAAINAANRAGRRQVAATNRAERLRQRAARQTTRVMLRESRQQTRALTQAARRISRVAQQEARKTQRAMSSGAAGSKGMGAAFAVVGQAATAAAVAIGLAATATFRFVDSQTAALDKIAKQSKQTGLGTQEYQRLAFAAERSGTSITALGGASKKLQGQLLDVQAGGGIALITALKEIGLGVEDIKGKDFEAQLGIIGNAMNLTASDTEKVGLSAKIFGMRAGPDMIPLLNEGAEGIKKLGDAAGELFNDEQLKTSERFQDVMVAAKRRVAQLVGEIAVGLVPVVERGIKKFQEWVLENDKLFKEQLPNGIAAMGKLISIVAEAVTVLGKLLAMTGDTETALQTFALGILAVKLALSGPAGMVMAAALAGAAIGNLMNAFGTSDALTDLLLDLDGLNKMLGIIDDRQSRVARGAPKTIGGQDVDTNGGKSKDLVEFTRNGETLSIGREHLLDLVTGKKTAGDLSQKEASAIFQQISADDRSKRLERANQRALANASKGQAVKDKEKKGKGGGKKSATGLEAQIESSFKEAADRAEVGASARALQEGKSGKEAFALGREAAKQTEARLRRNFDETGALPEGIARDVQSLARSPAVEDSIGRVPPPVITVTNNVTTITVSGNDFKTSVEASLSGVTVSELTRETNRATMRMVKTELGEAVANLMPKVRV